MTASEAGVEADHGDGGDGDPARGLDAAVRATFTAPGATPFTVDCAPSVPAGETLVVLGPSGSGKSLLLECLGGFHDHEGRVALDGRDLTDAPPERRKFGFVFQDYALFPNMTVRENVAFGARYHADVRDPDALLDALGVAHLAERSPRTLSGGEQQRVALARALAVRPDALLLDEPLSALDAPTRQRLREDLADVLADVTAVYVTHDRTTARALADRVAVMAEGRFVQVGPPAAVFEAPDSPFVARFTGANCLPLDGTPSLRGALSGLDGAEKTTHLAVRPEHVALEPAGTGSAATDGGPDPGTSVSLRGTVHRTLREDASHRVTVALDGAPGGTTDGGTEPFGVSRADAAGNGRDDAAARASETTRSTREAGERPGSAPGPTLDALAVDPPAVGATVDVHLPANRVTLLRADPPE